MNYQYRVMPLKNGTIYFMNYPYGYKIQVHIFDQPGYIVDKLFDSFRNARHEYITQCEKYGKKPNL